MGRIATFGEYSLEYEKYGTGDKILFAFHGFNRNAFDFHVFLPSLGQKFTIISFNLFYYGKSSVPKSEKLHAFTKSDLKGILEEVIQMEAVSKFSLLGYSLGGRLALSAIEVFEDRVESIFLLAPDGIKINKWNKWASNSLLGRSLYLKIIHKPELLFSLADFLRKKGFISDSLYRFVMWHMETKNKRQQVFNVWMIFRKLIPNISKIKRIINKYNIPTFVFFGAHDLIIPPSIGNSFANGLKQKNVVQVINTGHNLVAPMMNRYLEKVI